jgi:DNA ligase-1
MPNGTMKIYSRNSEDDTPKYPDIIKSLPHAFNTCLGQSTLVAADADESKEQTTATATSSDSTSTSSEPFIRDFILDAEVVAWDRVQHKIMPFQELSRRKKKDVEQSDITVQVCLFAFDLLYLNGQVNLVLGSLYLATAP